MDEPVNQPDYESALALLEQMAGASGLGGATFRSAARQARPGTTAPPADDDVPNRRRGWQPDLRYRSLVEKLPAVTFMAALDDGLQELYVSPQIEQLLGFTQDEWLDNPILWFDQLHPDDRAAWVTAFAETCSAGTHFRAEYRLLARDGRVVWVQGECQIIRDEEDGHPLFLQGIAFDITHLKRAAQVEEAKLAAEAASRAKSEFLARMSHEIRTPLNGVVGMIDLLRGTPMTDVQQRYAGLAREAADALMLVINDILDFSKIEAGKVDIEQIEFDPQKVVEDLTELLNPAAAKKGLALGCCVRADVPRRLVGDPNRIRQVLTNLVGNALKFTAKGHVRVRVDLAPGEARTFGPIGVTDPGSVTRVADPGSVVSPIALHDAPASSDGARHIVRVRVEDSGIGIPADRLDRLFKSFSQVDTSTTRKFGGTGLGLAISKRLVELMGGEIGIESEEGRGTTFWFTVALGVAADAPNETAAADAETARAVAATRVLAVEPDASYRQILDEQMEGRVAAGSVAVTVDEAVDAARRAAAEGKPFGVVLVPCGTPAGERVAAAFRADAALRSATLVAVTETGDTSDAAAVAAAGYAARLHRPITQSRLVEVVAAAVARRPAGGAVVRPATAGSAARDALRGVHLLVAEDNEMNQFVTRETLARVGCTCDIVGDGLLAVEAVASGRRYDAVLMDCQMPVLDGFEASRRIREREAAAGPGARRIPIIALTAEALAGDRERCLAAGMDGYATKPLNPNELFATIAERVAADRAAAPVPTAVAGGPATPAADAPAAAPAGPPEAARADAGPTDGVPIEVAPLLGRCMGDRDFAARTLEKFARRAADDVERLRAAVATGDAAVVTRLAHNLKSVAAHVSASALNRIASEIEQAGVRGDLAAAEQQLALLAEEARRCAAFVPRAIEGVRQAPRAA